MIPPLAEFALVASDPRVSPHDLTIIAAAITQFLAQRVCPVWGYAPVPCHAYASTSARLTQPGVAVCRIVPTVKGAPADALGWHDESKGKPRIFVEVDPVLLNGGVVVFDPAHPQTVTLASVIAHEVIETLGDRTVNRWVDDPTAGANGETAEELCDACEDAIVPVTVEDPAAAGTHVTVGLTSFLYPAWFDAQAKVGPYDEAGVCPAPFKLSRRGGGYKIIRQVVPNSETSAEKHLSRVLGSKYPVWRLAAKHEHSRGTRRSVATAAARE